MGGDGLQGFYETQRNTLEDDFERFTKISDIVVTGHFHGNNARYLTKEMLQSKDCKIKEVGDVSCDIDGPIALHSRSSTIAEPFYGFAF
jgi:hypothetical protein